MKSFALLAFCLLLLKNSNCQDSQHTQPILHSKATLEVSDTKNWVSVAGGQISNDGKYVYYTINHQPQGSQTLVIQSTLKTWKKEFIGATDAKFTNNSKWALFKQKDSLFIVDLISGSSKKIPGVAEYGISENLYLIFHKTTDGGRLFLQNIATGQEESLAPVSNYLIASGKDALLYEINANGGCEVHILNLNNHQDDKIWSGKEDKPSNYVWNPGGNALAFIVEKNEGNKKEYEVWYYGFGMKQADKIAENRATKIDSNLAIFNRSPQFSNNGKWLLISLQPMKSLIVKPNGVKVDIWNYRDSVIQSKQLEDVNKKILYTAAINIENKSVIRLEQENEKIISQSDEFVLTEGRLGLYGLYENEWNKSAQFSYYLISLTNGTRKLIKKGIVNPQQRFILSPKGKWIIYYDFKEKNYFSYETASGKTYNITKGVKTNWEYEENDHPEPTLSSFPVWLPDDNNLFLYDTYDIWLVDPSGKRAPENWTNGYGRNHNIVFRVLDGEQEIKRQLASGKNSTILLSAFNTENKNRGYFSKKFGEPADPQLHVMNPVWYGLFTNGYTFPPVKAKDATIYLDLRYSATEAPNYFITKNYKKLTFLTDIQPQKKYNWYTTELHNWQSLDGTVLQGILYKPENFDANKKYPVIFNYYEKRSNELNLFIQPGASQHEINIPLFVSRGYLVFVPDINYTIGEPGKSAYNAVVSAAKYLSQKPWVDSNKLGLQGHSFGGFETGYIITHTNIFTAACSASGIYDLVSYYASAYRANYPMYSAERDQLRMGKSLWEMPQAYLENSAIFSADNVTTPVLLMHNNNDRNVPFAQSLEFFSSLRRLGKAVWMLQYDNGDHSVEYGKDAEDYHKRMVQFFDHYLKDSPAPKWMSRGVPARMKGIDNGLE